jgi:hypothetical protein
MENASLSTESLGEHEKRSPSILSPPHKRVCMGGECSPSIMSFKESIFVQSTSHKKNVFFPLGGSLVHRKIGNPKIWNSLGNLF